MKSLNSFASSVLVAVFLAYLSPAQDSSSLAPALPHRYTDITKLTNMFEVETGFVLKASSQETLDLAKPKQATKLNPSHSPKVEVKARILKYGIATNIKGKSVAAPSDPTGKHLLTPGRLTVDIETNRIPAEIGIAFGCTFEIFGLPQKFGDTANVETVWTYPPMIKPDASVSKGFTSGDFLRVNTHGSVKGVTGYRFEKDFELVVGEWQLELRFEGKTLAKQNFTIFRE